MIQIETETERINSTIAAAAPLSTEKIIELEIQAWNNSSELKLMQLGERYYKGDHDILTRKKKGVGEGGRSIEDPHLTNKQLVHTFVRKLVDQKTGYLLSKAPSIQTKNITYAKALGDIFDKAFLRKLRNTGKNAINSGRSWIHPHYNEEGDLAFKMIPSEEGIPLWRDAAHTELDAFIRVYKQVEYIGMTKHVITKVEYWDKTGVKRYLFNAPGRAGLIPDTATGDVTSHFSEVTEGETELPLNWERVPFICFKYNDDEIPLIKFLQTLVDDYDEQTSDNASNLTDLPNGIFVLKEYDGADLGEFRKNLSLYRAVKTSGEGGVDTLTLDLNPEALHKHIEQLRKDIYEFGRGVDTQSDKFGGSPSGQALKFLYADLDMDANDLENEFQAALEQLLWFVDTDLANRGEGDFSDEQVDIIFNRDIAINETEATTNLKNSVGLISNKTIVSNHPLVTDANGELKQMKQEKEEALKDAQSYGGLTEEEPIDPDKGSDEP